MYKYVKKSETSLMKISDLRDQVLFLFIKPYWPRKILPNHITYVRLVVALLLFFLLFVVGVEDKGIILTLFIIGALTDLLDGSVARGLDKVTELGAFLDSTFDRLLIAPIAFYSLSPEHHWLLFSLVIVELCNGIFSIWYNTKEIYLESNIYGKIKMVIWSVVFAAILLQFPSPVHPLFTALLWLTIPLSGVTIFLRVSELRHPHEKTQPR